MRDVAFREIAQHIGISPFQIWLMEELDALEEDICGGELNGHKTLEARAQHKALLDVRDKYCELREKSKGTGIQ